MSFTGRDVVQQYVNHREEYQKVADHLETVRNHFETADRKEQRRVLLSSYQFAVLTVQTPTDIAEEAFQLYKGGEEMSEAFSKVNYWKNKARYIEETNTRFEAVDTVIDFLEEGEIDKAHRKIANTFKGVSTVKAAFVLAMIGYTSRMCVDTNVQQVADHIIDGYTGKKVSKYQSEAEKIREWFSRHHDGDTPDNFIIQWAIFDLNRGHHHTHIKYWETIQIPHPFTTNQ